MFKKIDDQLLILSAGLILEALKLLILALVLILLAEAVLPGIITDRINLTYVLILTMVLYFSYEKLARLFNFEKEKSAKKRKWIFPTAIFFSLLLLVRSLIKFEIWEIAIILTGISMVFYFVSKEPGMDRN